MKKAEIDTKGDMLIEEIIIGLFIAGLVGLLLCMGGIISF